MPTVRLTAAALVAIFALALALRVIPAWDYVFTGDAVVFQGTDASFHMRTIENLTHNFPHRLGFDPYARFPGGQPVPTGPFFDYLVATPAWVLGLGDPSDQLVAWLGALAPAVLGAAIALAVYWVGALAFGRLVGLFAASLTAILPGVFLSYTLVGLTDHHVTEALLYVLTLGAALAAVQADDVRRRRLWTVALGVLLGSVLLNRPAAFFVPALIAGWGALQAGLNLYRDVSSRKLVEILPPAFLIGAVMLPPAGDIFYADLALASLVGGALVTGAAAGCAEAIRRRGLPRWTWLVVAGLGAGLAAVTVAWLLPERVQAFWGYLTLTSGRSGGQTVGELRPLFYVTGRFDWRAGWIQFATAGVIAPIALLLMAWRALREQTPELTLLTAGGALMLTAALLQNRMTVYLAPHIGLLFGWVAAPWMRTGGPRRKGAVLAAIVAVVYLPNFWYGWQGAQYQRGPSADWRAALAWMRQNTPEPFGDPAAYLARHERPEEDSFQYPPSAYGVLCWWDHGYWIMRNARRLPLGNGAQEGALEAASFFTETDPAVAAGLLDEWRVRYIAVDETLPVYQLGRIGPENARFLAMLDWLGLPTGDYARTYYQPTNTGPQPLIIFQPDYYRSMLARLYFFEAESQPTVEETYVFAYDERTIRGRPGRLVTSFKKFDSFEDASRYMADRPDQPLILGGVDAGKTCVPLEGMPEYRLAFRAGSGELGSAAAEVGAVKIFEFRPEVRRGRP